MTIVTSENLNAGIGAIGGFHVSAVAIFYIALALVTIHLIRSWKRKDNERRILWDQEILEDDAPYYHKAYATRINHFGGLLR